MNTTTWIIILVAVILVDTLISALVAISIKKNSDAKKIGTAEDKARGIIDDAIKTAESKKKEALLEAKEENLKTKNELDKETDIVNITLDFFIRKNFYPRGYQFL